MSATQLLDSTGKLYANLLPASANDNLQAVLTNGNDGGGLQITNVSNVEIVGTVTGGNTNPAFSVSGPNINIVGNPVAEFLNIDSNGNISVYDGANPPVLTLSIDNTGSMQSVGQVQCASTQITGNFTYTAGVKNIPLVFSGNGAFTNTPIDTTTTQSNGSILLQIGTGEGAAYYRIPLYTAEPAP